MGLGGHGDRRVEEGSWWTQEGPAGVGPTEVAPHSGIHIQCPGHKVLRKSHGQKQVKKGELPGNKVGQVLTGKAQGKTKTEQDGRV